MDKTTNYVLGFVLAMTVIVALVLTTLFSMWKEASLQNEAIFNKRAILSALGNHLDTNVKNMSDQDVLDVFAKDMDQLVLDMNGKVIEGKIADKVDMAKERKKPEAERHLPLYIYKKDGRKFYVLSIRGNGLWDEIWGNIALEDDLNTVTGAMFDHKGETPGLGAEIKDNPSFAKQFEGKKLYEDDGDYVSITVQKGKAKNLVHEVDGISGATVTCVGVTEMLVRGIRYYEPYFKQLKEATKSGSMGMLVQ